MCVYEELMENWNKPTKWTYTNSLKSVRLMGDDWWDVWSAPSCFLFMHGPALFQCFQAVNDDIFVKPRRVLVYRFQFLHVRLSWSDFYHKTIVAASRGTTANVVEVIRTHQRSRRGQTAAKPWATWLRSHTHLARLVNAPWDDHNVVVPLHMPR